MSEFVERVEGLMSELGLNRIKLADFFSRSTDFLLGREWEEKRKT